MAVADPADKVASSAKDSAVTEAAGAVEEATRAGTLEKVVKVLGAVAGSTTILTAFLYSFGYFRAYYFYLYLGVDSSVLDLSLQEYLLQSTTQVLSSLIAGGLAGLITLRLYTVARKRLLDRPGSRIRLIPPATVTCGLLLTANFLSQFLVYTPVNQNLILTPLCLTVGILLVLYGVHLNHVLVTARDAGKGPPKLGWSVAEWTLGYSLVAVGIFAAVFNYSNVTANQDVRELVAQLPTSPPAVLYSVRQLALAGPDVIEETCRNPNAAYRFRYYGLTLINQSAGQYLFLPRSWTTENGAAILLPRNDSIRLEFSPASTDVIQRRTLC